MKCPRCEGVNLLMSERQGVEIDYCPECRGVWLDRGELDKIIEKTNLKQNDNYYYDDDDHHEKHNKYSNHGKKRGFFDFFD